MNYSWYSARVVKLEWVISVDLKIFSSLGVITLGSVALYHPQCSANRGWVRSKRVEHFKYRVYSSDVMAAILVSQNNEMAAILLHILNESYGTLALFLFKHFLLFLALQHGRLSREWKHSIESQVLYSSSFTIEHNGAESSTFGTGLDSS